MELTLSLLLPPVAIGLVLATLTGNVAARLGFPVPDETRRLGTIDGLRGYLALLVMVHHFAIWAVMPETRVWADGPLMLANSFGAGCVCLFFMITGCLFFPKALAGRATDWRSLYISRLFRILPLQAVVVAVASLVALASVGLRFDMELVKYPYHAAQWLVSWSEPSLFGFENSAMINAMVLWSLFVEWQFYFIGLPFVALLCWAVGMRARWLVPLLLILGGTLAHLTLPRSWSTLGFFAVFGYGMLAGTVRATRAAGLFRSGWAGAISAVLLGLTMLLTPHPDDPLPLLAYALFFHCVACGNRFGGLLTTRGAIVLGEASFGIYMLHGIVLYLAFTGAADPIAALPIASRVWLLPLLMPLAAAVSMALFLLVERPAIRLGRQVARHGRPATATANPAVNVAP